MYGVAIGGVTGKEVPPGVSGQRWQQQLSQKAARGPFWVARHSRNTHSLGTNHFLGWHQVMGCATGLNCVLGVNGEPKMVSYWQWAFDGSAPLTLKVWVARAMTTPKAHLSVPREGGSPQRSWSSPLLLPSSTCHHKAEGNQVSCRFGPARKAADWSKQVNSPKLKCFV